MNYGSLTPITKYRTRNSWHWSSRFFTSRVIRSPTESDEELRIFIVAGEVSGDIIGSRLMASLKLLSPVNVKFAGVGGSLMVKEGLQSQFPMEDLAVMGVWELVPHIQKFWVRLKQATQSALDFQAHVIVTVDSKGFSFRLLKYIRAGCAQRGLACPVCVHYVAPSFWAWKGGEKRLKGLRNIVDHILCILPFEEEICKMNGLAATFVGHPILEDVFNKYAGDNLERSKWKVVGDGAKFRKENGLSADATIISLLPGSRIQEVDHMLPIFGQALGELKHNFNDLTAAIPVAPNEQVAKSVKKFTERWTVPVVLLSGESLESIYNAFDASIAALSTSGTAVLQLQLARLPCVVAYRASLLTEWLIQFRTKLSYISLPNILMDSTVLPEALFSECTPSRLAIMIRQLVQNEHLQNQQAIAAEKIFDILKPPVKHLSGVSFQWTNSSQLLQKLRAPTPSGSHTIPCLFSCRFSLKY
ncbi:hypothetical protein SUGI_0201870 [Cryptomeria japonica]|nr:hypothetical protein SUGI_0201870 [Cryptomeria japonica]